MSRASYHVTVVREGVFAALAILSVVPLWAVEHPPIQDLPQHLAAIRVLLDHGDPHLHFAEYFDIGLARTQYLAYYLVAQVLAWPLGVQLANRLLVSIAIIGTPYAMRALLRALGRDERLAIFLFPLVWNAHLILGFFNFIAAIPLAILGLVWAVELRRNFRAWRAIGFAVLSVVTFYTHVVPFAFLALGAVLVFLDRDVRASVVRCALLLPSVFAAIVWTQVSRAGEATLTAAFMRSDDIGPRPTYMSVAEAFREAPSWLTDVLHVEWDEKLLVVWAALVLLTLAFGYDSSERTTDTPIAEARDATLVRRLGLLAPCAFLAYFVTPASYDWIWPINARFPLLALIFLVPVLPFPRRLLGLLITVALIGVSVASSVVVIRAFRDFETLEVGELDDALATIPVGQRVAGLVFDRGSREVKFAPFIHSAAWYQAEKGGAVMFTFADFPQSPFRFKEDNRPPRVVPRWEWMPERVDPRRDLEWYDYVLVRGGPGRIASQTDVYEPVFRGPTWSVWKRTSRAAR